MSATLPCVTAQRNCEAVLCELKGQAANLQLAQAENLKIFGFGLPAVTVLAIHVLPENDSKFNDARRSQGTTSLCIIVTYSAVLLWRFGCVSQPKSLLWEPCEKNPPAIS
jgi:hypothetical protein